MRCLINTCAVLFSLLSFSCNNGNNNDTRLDRQVMKEIFPSLMDSLYVETMFSLSPPPAEQIRDSVTGQSITVPIAASKRNKDQFRKELADKYKDSLIITLVVNDEVHTLHTSAVHDFEIKYSSSDKTVNQGYRLGPDEIINGKLCRTVLYSVYTVSPKPVSQLLFLKDFSLSIIVFNKDLNRGMLHCDYVCGNLCGFGYEIYIKKENEKWVIDRVEQIWVS